ncbi:MAG: hypothetical protein ACK58L_05600 [Planctomycetota bacterium]
MDSSSVFYAVPLTAIISLVYSASRFELPSRIFSSAAIMFLKTIAFLGALYVFLLYMSN